LQRILNQPIKIKHNRFDEGFQAQMQKKQTNIKWWAGRLLYTESNLGHQGQTGLAIVAMRLWSQGPLQSRIKMSKKGPFGGILGSLVSYVACIYVLIDIKKY
jgi:hypothetical protein